MRVLCPDPGLQGDFHLQPNHLFMQSLLLVKLPTQPTQDVQGIVCHLQDVQGIVCHLTITTG
jgi:hypothetical protein